TAHIVFPDNGVYEGTVTVTDPTGLSVTQDLAPFTIANASPGVDPVQGKSAEWGDVVKYHVDAFDAAGDQDSLAYHWSFGDGASANGQDVEHAFATPGVYNGAATATHKDGGSSAPATLTTPIVKRPAEPVYPRDGRARPARRRRERQVHARLADGADDHHGLHGARERRPRADAEAGAVPGGVDLRR